MLNEVVPKNDSIIDASILGTVCTGTFFVWTLSKKGVKIESCGISLIKPSTRCINPYLLIPYLLYKHATCNKLIHQINSTPRFNKVCPLCTKPMQHSHRNIHVIISLSRNHSMCRLLAAFLRYDFPVTYYGC